MITIVTNTTSVIELTAYPFTGSVMRRGKEVPVLAIPCSPSMDLDAVKEMFENETSTVRMVLMDGGTLIREYTDYTKMEEISWVQDDVDETGQELPGYYVVKMAEKISYDADLLAVKKAMGDLRRSVEEVNTKKEEQDKTIDGLKKEAETIAKSIEGIEQSMQDVDPDSLELPELKDYLIGKSKENLSEHLATNPISSSVHGGVVKQYSITADKQTHLMAMILMTANMEEARIAGMKQFYETQYSGKESVTFEQFMVGVDNGTISTGGVTFNKYQPSWNAAGEPCTYDWTLNELKQLAAEIEAVVRPLISKQQTMEVQIKGATTIEEAKSVSLSFAAAPKMHAH